MSTELLAEAPPAVAADPLLRDGWCVTRGLFDTDEVRSLRHHLEAAFEAPVEGAKAPPECGRILADLFVWPEVWPRFFNAAMFAALRAQLGDGLVLLPEHSAHRDGYGGWHKDTDMFERAGLMQHWAPDFGIHQCAVYLQDNSALTGGGLSVVPGSHLVPRPSATLVNAGLREQWFAARPQQVLDSRAGDLVIFNTRLDHMATPRVAPPPQSKLALFFIATRNDRHAAAYSHFIHQRKDYTYLQSYRVPDAAQALARQHGMFFSP